MKHSNNLTQVLLLRRFPEHHRMSRPHLSTFDLKKILFFVCSGTLMALLTAGTLMHWSWKAVQEEKIARQQSDERLERMHYEVERLQQLSQYSANEHLDLAKTLHEVVESGQGDQKLFLSLMVPEALRIQISHGIPASATVAMSIYESAYGRSQLAGVANNFFGIKAFASVWDGPTVYIATRDNGRKTKAYFRQYPDIEAAVLGYATFLKNSDRYAQAFNHRDGPGFVASVLKAGYCPDGDYHENILSIMERHQLAKLDLPVRTVDAGKTDREGDRKIAGIQTLPPWEKKTEAEF